jgi:hypothetical protein
MESTMTNARRPLLWVALITVASAITTLALACATPFAALAALAATRMRARDGVLIVSLAWAANQAVGFGVLGYPHDWTTMAWGPAILSAALAAIAAAAWGARQSGGRPVLGVATAFGTGFVAYKLVLLAWSFLLGGVHTAASPYWTALQFGREALFLAGLLALYHVLVAAGVPAPRRAALAR